MKTRDASALRRLARLHGVQTSYLDMAGNRRHATPEVLSTVLDALGEPVAGTSEIHERLQHFTSTEKRRIAPPVVVAWDGKASSIRVGCTVRAEVELEDGTRKLVEIQNNILRLPRLPVGYHRLRCQANGKRIDTLVIAAPTESYSDPDLQRSWGVFLPLYALRSKRSWGAANFTDWQRLATWIGKRGGTVLSSLPILSAFLDKPFCEPGPYSPASRLFWNEFYVDIEALPEFQRCGEARRIAKSRGFLASLKEFRAAKLVDWAAQWHVRQRVLEELAAFFFKSGATARRAHFDKFNNVRVEDYARFRAACDQTSRSWWTWPSTAREGELPVDLTPLSKIHLHQYVQWAAYEQIQQLFEHCERRGVRLYLDLPLGVNPDSYDVWRYRHEFALRAKVGCPPDPTFPSGQDWGFSPLHPQRIRETHYRYVIEFLRFQMRHTRMLRIDHVMALHRLYWVPEGRTAKDGAFVEYNAEELYAIFCLESQRNKTVLVGEDLGTVPQAVTNAMNRHRFRRMFVVQYDLQPKKRAALPQPPAESVASLNTHDMPPFANFAKGLDIVDRASLGLMPQTETKSVFVRTNKHSRKRLLKALKAFLASSSRSKPASNKHLQAALLDWLAASDAETVLINLEDLWNETLPQNVPATSTERPNWQRVARYSLEQIIQSPTLRRQLAPVNRLRRA